MKQLRLIVGILLVAFIVFTAWQFYYHREPISDSQANLDYDANLVVENVGGEGIAVINDPIFESVSIADSHLSDDGLGVALSFGGKERFYPFQILSWHEIVNDSILGTPLLIYYGPLAGTAVVYDRDVGGEILTFAQSGKIYNNSSVLQDAETNSLWLPILGKSVEGSLVGQELRSIPFSVISWGEWKGDHRGGEVLSRRTGVIRDYTTGPYVGYADSNQIWFPLSVFDSRLQPKEIVYGAIVNNQPTAYPINLIGEDIILPNNFVYTYWFSWAAAYPNTQIIESE